MRVYLIQPSQGLGGEGGGPSGYLELGGPPLVAQPPTAGVAVGVAADGGGGGRLALDTPAVPHLPAPATDSSFDDLLGGDVNSGFTNSPVHEVLLFESCTPNPSAPAFGTQGSDRSLSFLHADPQSCISCNRLFTPRRGENCYGKCDDCLDSAFHSFADLHGIVSGPMFGPCLHDEQPPVSITGDGDPMGGSLEPSDTSGGGSNSLFLSLAPVVFCRRCGVAFRPPRGLECNSLCLSCSSQSFLRSPSPKRRRLGGEGFGPPP